MYSRLCISLFLPYFIRINLSYTFSSHRVFWYRLLRGVFDESAMLLPTWKFLFWLHTFFKTKFFLLLKSTNVFCTIKNQQDFFAMLFYFNLQNHYHSAIVPHIVPTILLTFYIPTFTLPCKIISLAKGTHLHLGPFLRKWVSYSRYTICYLAGLLFCMLF